MTPYEVKRLRVKFDRWLKLGVAHGWIVSAVQPERYWAAFVKENARHERRKREIDRSIRKWRKKAPPVQEDLTGLPEWKRRLLELTA